MCSISYRILPLVSVALCACTSTDLLEDYNPPAVCPDRDVIAYPVEPPSQPVGRLSEISRDAIVASNGFAFDFYRANSAVCAENICVSPLSMCNVLAMLANGDDGNSRDEILNLIGFKTGEEGLADLNRYFRTVLSNLPNLDDTSCIFTNSVWYHPCIGIFADFQKNVAEYYNAVHIGMSPAGADGKEIVNEFVKTNTYGQIEDFIDEPIDSYVALLNTSYFKGQWKYPFDCDFTDTGTFVNIDYSESEADFMHGLARCEYAMTSDGTEAVRIPIGEDGHFSMTLILPSSQINHVPLDEALDCGNIEELESNLEERVMLINLPRFRVHYKNSHTLDILTGMGLEYSCTDTKGFRKIVDSPLPFYLDSYIHAASISVDEYGTEGAAAGSGHVDLNPDINEPVGQITFNRPFIFTIRENSTGIILFVGSIKKI